MLSLSAFIVLWLARWPSFPLMLDASYHLLIAQQIVDAGGVLTHEWWEWAPVGRPHLYPPVLHLVLAALLKFGCAPLTAIRVMSAGLPPLLLISLWMVTRRLFTPWIALVCLWMGLMPFAFHLHAAMAMAATLGMIELLWLWDALEHRRWMAAGLLLALLSYTHLGLPWIALVALGCYGALRPQAWPLLLKASGGLLLAIPWWIHLVRYRTGFQVIPRQENAMLELMPLMYAMAIGGVWRCWMLRGRFAWPLAWWVGCALLAFRFLYRWVSGEGMLPIILLAGIGLTELARFLRLRAQRDTAIGALVLGVVALSPTLMRTPDGWRWAWFDSAPWHLVSLAPTTRSLETGVYAPPITRLVDVVKAQTQPGEILWSNAPYALGLIAALAHRPTASAMLDEVRPARPFDPIGAAHLIVWFKLERLGDAPEPIDADRLRRYSLIRVHEDDIALVYRQQAILPRAAPPQARVPLGLALGLMAAACGLIAWDMRKGQVVQFPV